MSRSASCKQEMAMAAALPSPMSATLAMACETTPNRTHSTRVRGGGAEPASTPICNVLAPSKRTDARSNHWSPEAQRRHGPQSCDLSWLSLEALHSVKLNSVSWTRSSPYCARGIQRPSHLLKLRMATMREVLRAKHAHGVKSYEQHERTVYYTRQG